MTKKKEEITSEEETLEVVTKKTATFLPEGAHEKEIVGADGKKYIKTYSADGSSLGVRPVEEVKE